MYAILELPTNRKDGFKPMKTFCTVFVDLERAEEVLATVAAKYPGNEFVLLKAIKSVKMVPVFNTETIEF